MGTDAPDDFDRQLMQAGCFTADELALVRGLARLDERSQATIARRFHERTGRPITRRWVAAILFRRLPSGTVDLDAERDVAYTSALRSWIIAAQNGWIGG